MIKVGDNFQAVHFASFYAAAGFIEILVTAKRRKSPAHEVTTSEFTINNQNQTNYSISGDTSLAHMDRERSVKCSVWKVK